MMHHRPPAARVVAGLFVLALATGLTAQDSGTDPRQTFGEAIDVELVELTFYAVRRGGEPVPDLRLDELRIDVDGEPVEPTHFAVHLPAPDRGESEALPEIETPAASRETAGAGPETADASRSVAIAEPIRYIAYVDDLNLRPHSRRRVLDELRDFFDGSLKDGDEVMVVSSLPRLRIHQGFTTDRGAVLASLEALDTGRAAGTIEDQERSSLMQEVAYRYMDADAAALEQDRLETSMRIQEEQELARARRSLEVLDELIGALAGLPGRKVLLHVSDGLAMTPSEDLLERLAARAAAARVVLVPIDGGGAATLDPRSGVSAGAVGSFWSANAAQLRQDDRQLTLLALAEETGGRLLLLKNLESLPEMRENLDVYYTVAFAAPPGPPGRDRGVRIRTDRRGVEIRHPRSFRIHSADERLRRSLRSALADPGAARNPLGMKIDLGTAVELDEGGWVLPLMIRVPLERVALLPGPAGHEGSLTILWMVADREGGVSRVFEEAMPIAIPDKQWEEAKGQDAGVQLRLRLSPNVDRAALAVRDDVGGATVAVGFPLKFQPAESG